MINEVMRQEINEAIVAGEHALQSLKSAQEKLNSAGNWGIWDILGGGFLVTMMKQSKMEDAQKHINDAQYYIKVFQKELKDVNVAFNLKTEVESFLSFADFFFDGLFTDFLVQSKISEAKTQVAEAIFRVEELLRELKKN